MKIFILVSFTLSCLIASSLVHSKTIIQVQMIMGKDLPNMLWQTGFQKMFLLLQTEKFFEILPKLKTTETRGLLEKISKGDIGGGIAWTHYWSAYHPATMLFGSPTAGAGLGFDNISWVSWFLYGGGRRLYDQLWSEMGMNIKGLMLQPQGLKH